MKAESRNYSQYLAQKNNPPPKLHDNTYSMASTCLQGNHVNPAASFSFDPSLLEGEVADTPTSPGLNSRTNPNGSTCNPSSDADQIMDLLTHRQVLKELSHFRLLYKAALRGDWGAANLFLQRNPDAVAAKINVSWMTALSVAASAGHAQFVQKLVEKMSVKQLESKDRLGRTALFYAAMADCTQSAKAMVTKNPNLTQIRNDENATPLLCALTYGSKKMVRYLYSVTRDEDPSPFRGGNGVRLLVFMIASGFYDTALDLVQRYPQLATARDDKSGYTALLALSQRPSAFPSKSRYGFLERLIYSLISVEKSGSPRPTINGDVENPPESGNLTQVPDRPCSLLNAQINKVPMVKQVRDMKLTQIQSVKLVNRICEQLSSMETDEMLECFLNPAVLNIAAEHGNTEVVIQCCEYFPDLLWLTMKGRSIFHVAVEHRQEKIFSLVYGMSARRRLLTSLRVDDSNTMLHMVAKLAPSPQLNVASGAALQMQRELQWFKAILLTHLSMVFN
ncbi:PREDICTED: uncharacterized protein LOC104588485 [Nelumbo nucifera]|uniref:Uncharacterized protein LOC104588485 n=2 Tax=Nelumbo nucifera TaxID=4432 RepID=A0A1U8Q148_NELNU|nr:PREDICTED: uncharacterized protein LOC104588485 [Nelumbo nucifera]DAD38503.1 TPA_asm: hypothetical protein HUJ06_009144 [Nelumbo nucifera]